MACLLILGHRLHKGRDQAGRNVLFYHDIRTPMNAVLGFTTLLARDAENPVKVREYTRKITASGQHLLSLINDILSNAVKYTPEGGHIWLRLIGLKQRSSQYEHIRVEVEDDGYGMTPEYLETIFDAFTRAENSTTNKVQGAGPGMAITKSVVELLGLEGASCEDAALNKS